MVVPRTNSYSIHIFFVVLVVVLRSPDSSPDLHSNWRSNVSYFEAFDPETEEWSDLKRNPFFPELSYSYDSGTTVTKEDSFLVFGGYLSFYTERSSQSFQNII